MSNPVEVTDSDFADLPLFGGSLEEDTRAILAMVVDSETFLDWDGLVREAYERNEEAAAQFLFSIEE